MNAGCKKQKRISKHKENEKLFKKVLDKCVIRWYHNQAVSERSVNEKKKFKKQEKVLDKMNFLCYHLEVV